MNECAIRTQIRELLAAGRLQRQGALGVIAGYGDGTLCEACGHPTRYSQVIYKANFGGAEPRSILMHYECYEVWRRERAACPTEDVHSAA